MITFIGAHNEQAYYTDYLLKRSNKGVDSHYPERFVMQDTGSYIKNTTTAVVIVGLGFKKSEQDSFTNSIMTSDNPNVEIRHFASWGDIIQGDKVISKVDEVGSPIRLMYNTLKEGLVDEEEFSENIVEYLDSYHRFTFKEGTPVMVFKALADFYTIGLAEKLIRTSYKTNVELIRDNLEEIRVETTKRSAYIKDRAETATVSVVANTAVVMLYAESYVNELAYYLKGLHQKDNIKEVIVLVGKHTRGSDMFSIRTSEGVDAEQVAKALGSNMGGKPRVATVFLTRPVDSLTNVVTRQLLTML